MLRKMIYILCYFHITLLHTWVIDINVNFLIEMIQVRKVVRRMRVRLRASFDNMFRWGSARRTESWLKWRSQWEENWETSVPGRRHSSGRGLELWLSLTCFRSQKETSGAGAWEVRAGEAEDVMRREMWAGPRPHRASKQVCIWF